MGIERGRRNKRIEGEPEGGNDSLATGVDKWLSCESSIPVVDVLSIPQQSQGAQRGYNSDYSCKNPNVVGIAERHGHTIDRFSSIGTNEIVLETLTLCSGGWTDSSDVQKTLDGICGQCSFYKSKRS